MYSIEAINAKSANLFFFKFEKMSLKVVCLEKLLR